MLSRLVVGCWIGLSLLPACASEPHGSGGTSDTPANAGRSSSGNGANGGSTSAVPNAGGGPGGLVLDVNAGSANRDDGAAGCSRLNIGILGNPGANASSNFQQWLMKSGTSAERIQTTADVPLTSAALEAFDVVVLD